jgi:uncharacterized protein YjgD (DUF1641 family)
MQLMEFLRQEQFANEIAKELNKPQIQEILKKSREFLEFATHIKNNCLYFDYEVTPERIDTDIKSLHWNIREFRKALIQKRNEPIQYVTLSNEMHSPIYLN